MAFEPIWLAGKWRAAAAKSGFRAHNPATGESLPPEFPVSEWSDCDQALDAAAAAARELRAIAPEKLAAFLEDFAAAIEAHVAELVELAHEETALAIAPRLREVELPRTTAQLRQGAAAAREGSWARPVLDTRANIRSHYAAIGPVVVFGPNNFPFAFNAVSGGDFTAAIAAGNPVIAKAHPLHPATSRRLAECAAAALEGAGLPAGAVQMLYHLDADSGLRLVSDRRVGAVGFTGSRAAGLRLKAAADQAGKPIYLEMSSLNPVVLLPGALAERGPRLAAELADSCLAGSGQFCTSPNLLLALAGRDTEDFAAALAAILAGRPATPLLSAAGLENLEAGVRALLDAGATAVTGAARADGGGYRYRNTLLRADAAGFLAQPTRLQREAFGNATMLVTARDRAELLAVLAALEANLTAAIYSSGAGADDAFYPAVAAALRSSVGRLLNDKVPTGVALSPAMQHGGPYPATGHPGFTAVGIPAAMLRFAALECYDNVRPDRLPPALRDQAPNPAMWRQIDGDWRQR